MKILFVCARNQWRSPTAEKIFSKRTDLEVRSAGLSPKSPRKISIRDLEWADVVLAMEEEHKARILEQFRGSLNLPQIHVLEIPDSYRFMDPELISLLEEAVEEFLSVD